MPKRLLPVLLLVASAALTACGDDGEDSARDTTPTSTPASSETSEPSAPASDDGSGPCQYLPDGSGDGEVSAPPSNPSVSGTVDATMETSVGAFRLALDADATPCTVNSFVSLAEQGYFDATSCHRLTTEQAGIQVLQCGDPTATGMGGPGYTIEDEVTPETTYPAGTLAMAKTAAPDSGGSQFFIVYGETPLPPEYTVFGTVDDAGLKAVQDAAKKGTTSGAPDGEPKVAVELKSVMIED